MLRVIFLNALICTSEAISMTFSLCILSAVYKIWRKLLSRLIVWDMMLYIIEFPYQHTLLFRSINLCFPFIWQNIGSQMSLLWTVIGQMHQYVSVGSTYSLSIAYIQNFDWQVNTWLPKVIIWRLSLTFINKLTHWQLGKIL